MHAHHPARRRSSDDVIRAGAFASPLEPDGRTPASATSRPVRHDDPRGLAEQVASVAARLDLGVAVAESLTGGLLASELARASDAAAWFRGGVVAYSVEAKRDVLGVSPGPVVSEAAVRDMVEGVAERFSADAAVAVSGAAGPDPLEGNPPGTVWLAVRCGPRVVAELHHLDGDPAAVCSRTCSIALDLLVQLMDPVE